MLFPEIEKTVESFDFNKISDDRKAVLQPLIEYIQNKVNNKERINLNFICTHNSRRSHLSQIWAQAGAAYYKIKQVYCYSGGTEVTAMHPMIAAAFRASGFRITALSEGENPVYTVKYAPNRQPVIGFSKLYDADFNPTSEFAAIMTCSQADGGCPFIAGAEKRIPITFEDPKISDNTPQQKEMYQQCSQQIGTEMLYVFSKIQS
ncbi:arsenate-mycothiol transferase ArsC [Flavobacterium sp. 22076]|jgi:arsenate reductase|uniref:arsenate-mycothiol transferase ArsC n=1 Tax=unclassified Flavobacterium TaxID=196869 RepID=UPI003F85898A